MPETLNSNQFMTLLEWAKTVDPNGGFYKVAEILDKKNAIMQDALWREANMKLNHLLTVRNSLQTGTWRQFYGVTAPERSTKKQVTEHVGMLKGYSEVDCDEAKLSGDVNGFRDSELIPYIEGMMQNLGQTTIYGDMSSNPEGFNGFATRLNSLAGTPTAGKALGAGGTGSKLTSLFLVGWGEDKVHMLYPTGQPNEMVKVTDRQQQTIFEKVNGVDGRREVYQNYLEISGGLAIKDARYVGRIANIQTDIADNLFLAHVQGILRKLSQILRFMPGAGMGATIYGNADVMAMFDSYMDLKPSSSTSIQYSRGEVGNLQVATVSQRPLKLCEQIVTGEALVA